MNGKRIDRKARLSLYRFAAAVVFWLAAILNGCGLYYRASPYAFIDDWKAGIVHPPSCTRQPLPPAEAAKETGYGLFLLTRSAGIDFSSGRINAGIFRNRQHTPRSKNTSGHSWLILQSPAKQIECGHTLLDYKQVHKYFHEVLHRAEQGHPNPGAYVLENQLEGMRHGRVYQFKPTFVAYFPLIKVQYDEISAYIENYDFSYFSLLDHECTHFVVGAACLAGIQMAYEVLLTVPAETSYQGRKVRLWRDGRFSSFKLASPDVLEDSLRRLVDSGIGQDATGWYRKRQD